VAAVDLRSRGFASGSVIPGDIAASISADGDEPSGRDQRYETLASCDAAGAEYRRRDRRSLPLAGRVRERQLLYVTDGGLTSVM